MHRLVGPLLCAPLVFLPRTQTYPILGIMACAVGLVIYQGQRILLNHPDITFDKSERSSVMRENDEEAEKHHEHYMRVRSRASDTQIMPGQSTTRRQDDAPRLLELEHASYALASISDRSSLRLHCCFSAALSPAGINNMMVSSKVKN
jgi:hypothetical protein